MAWGALALCAIVGCSPSRESRGEAQAATIDRDSVARVRQDSINRAQPGYVVDSILPPDEALRRFQEGVANPGALVHGAASRDALVQQFVRAVEANDSLTLIRSAVHRGEYAHLIYSRSSLAQGATYQPPEVAWVQLSNGSVQGFRRTLARHGGHPLGFASYRCPEAPERHGDLTIWRGCLVELETGEGRSTTRLFGPIVSRNGQFKFLSLANDL